MSQPTERFPLSAPRVKRLVSAQFPHWAELPVVPVKPSGWDNHTFRLGEDMLVRLPSAARYAAQVEKEQQWLPRLAGAGLPVRIPKPLAMGAPAADLGYPFAWSVYKWIDGECASPKRINDHSQFARDLAAFLRALHQLDTTGGPAPGKHNFFRGGSLHVYADETLAAIQALRGEIDTNAASKMWDAALQSTWGGTPVWVHGDLAPGNLLVRKGKLHAVIDFGGMSVGDPACDLVMAWTFFESDSRAVFRTAVGADDETWRRARGWALWKALIILAGHIDAPANRHGKAQQELTALLSDPSG